VILARASLIAPSRGRGSLTEQVTCDLIWLHITPADRVEHIRVQASARGFEVVWFMLGDDPLTARINARLICRTAIANTPALLDWKIA